MKKQNKKPTENNNKHNKTQPQSKQKTPTNQKCAAR